VKLAVRVCLPAIAVSVLCGIGTPSVAHADAPVGAVMFVLQNHVSLLSARPVAMPIAASGNKFNQDWFPAH
jgi:hypothetical protein